MPRTEATNWRLVSGCSAHTRSEYTLLKSKNGCHKLTLHCMTILAEINVKSWAQSVECSVLSAECWVLSTEYWVLSAECWVLSAERWLLQSTAEQQQIDGWFLIVVHILGQNIHWYSPKTEAIHWRLHCRTILARIKVKSWAQSVEYWELSTECWVLSAECWVLSAECWVLGTECWVLSAEWWLQQFTALRG